MEEIRYNEWIYEFHESDGNIEDNSYMICQYNFDNEDFMNYTMYRDYDYITDLKLEVRIQNCYFQIMEEEIEYDRDEKFINELGNIESETNQHECNMRDWMMSKYEELSGEIVRDYMKFIEDEHNER